MRLLTNPVFLKMIGLLFASGFALMTAAFLIRSVRQRLGEDDARPARDAGDHLALLAVIQQLKQQKQENTVLKEAEQRRSDRSKEMARTLRSSLITISGYTQGLIQNRDPDVAARLAAGIAAEAQQLEQIIGGFLAEGTKTYVASATHS